jgi:Mn-dependent DtxR family transcriptional regulator
MIQETGFHTLKGYQLSDSNMLTYAMEDYLEMICRMLRNTNVVRINELAKNLNVRPSSASKMVNNLKYAGFITFEKYGYITITQKGLDLGNYLLYRHDVLNRFLCKLNRTNDELEQVEKIEHFLNIDTIHNLEKLTIQLENVEKMV